MKIVATPFAVKVEPVRTHRRRRGQSMAYHQRVEKKWLKRFGTKQVPSAYQADGRLFGYPGPILFVHPLLMSELKKHFDQP